VRLSSDGLRGRIGTRRLRFSCWSGSMGADPLTGAHQPAQRVTSHPLGDRHPLTPVGRRPRAVSDRARKPSGHERAPDTARFSRPERLGDRPPPGRPIPRLRAQRVGTEEAPQPCGVSGGAGAAVPSGHRLSERNRPTGFHRAHADWIDMQYPLTDTRRAVEPDRRQGGGRPRAGGRVVATRVPVSKSAICPHLRPGVRADYLSGSRDSLYPTFL
jgi:hypothetical protein